MTRQIIFAGPSLHGTAVSLPPDTALRPPAAKGDLLAALDGGVVRIGIIDGTFDHGAAIWHKEILQALALGIEILGAASMGALRAAECAAFGMIGIGVIYEDYAHGRRTADEDVALVHGPSALGYPPLTDALVDIDATLARLTAANALDPHEQQEIAALARRRHFKERHWGDLCTAIGRPELNSAFFSQKRADALCLIEAMRQPLGPRQPFAAFNDTLFFRVLADEVAARAREQHP